jgi:hypothetical protein
VDASFDDADVLAGVCCWRDGCWRYDVAEQATGGTRRSWKTADGALGVDASAKMSSQQWQRRVLESTSSRRVRPYFRCALLGVQARPSPD